MSRTKHIISILVIALLMLISCSRAEQYSQEVPATPTMLPDSSDESDKALPSDSPDATPVLTAIPMDVPTPVVTRLTAPFMVDRKFYADAEIYESQYGNLLNPDLNPASRTSIEENMRFMDQDAIIRATAAVLPPVVGRGFDHSLPNPTEPPMPRGIIWGGPGPFSGTDFQMENMWQDEYNGDWWLAYAGAEGPDPSQGSLIMLQLQMPRFPTKVIRNIRLTTPGGSLHIVAVENMMMTLENTSGQRFVFDMLHFKYVQ